MSEQRNVIWTLNGIIENEDKQPLPPPPPPTTMRPDESTWNTKCEFSHNDAPRSHTNVESVHRQRDAPPCIANMQTPVIRIDLPTMTRTITHTMSNCAWDNVKAGKRKKNRREKRIDEMQKQLTERENLLIIPYHMQQCCELTHMRAAHHSCFCFDYLTVTCRLTTAKCLRERARSGKMKRRRCMRFSWWFYTRIHQSIRYNCSSFRWERSITGELQLCICCNFQLSECCAACYFKLSTACPWVCPHLSSGWLFPQAKTLDGLRLNPLSMCSRFPRSA